MFCCKGKRLANYLLDHGCKLVRIDMDQKANGFLVFLFLRNKRLDDAMLLWQDDRHTYLL